MTEFSELVNMHTILNDARKIRPLLKISIALSYKLAKSIQNIMQMNWVIQAKQSSELPLLRISNSENESTNCYTAATWKHKWSCNLICWLTSEKSNNSCHVIDFPLQSEISKIFLYLDTGLSLICWRKGVSSSLQSFWLLMGLKGLDVSSAMKASISSTVRGTQVSSSTPSAVTAISSSIRTWERDTHTQWLILRKIKAWTFRNVYL